MLDQEPEAKGVKTRNSSPHDAHLAAARTLATMSSRVAAGPLPPAAAPAVAEAPPSAPPARGFDLRLEHQQGPVAAEPPWVAQPPPAPLARGADECGPVATAASWVAQPYCPTRVFWGPDWARAVSSRTIQVLEDKCMRTRGLCGSLSI